jgi:hypothetical protein
MHKKSKQNDYWERDAQQPQQCAFAKAHSFNSVVCWVSNARALEKVPNSGGDNVTVCPAANSRARDGKLNPDAL